MEKLKHNEKIAVIKILNEILKADGVTHEKEIEYLNSIIASFDLNKSHWADVDALITLQAMDIIRGMSVDKKVMVAQLMGKMIVVDNDINYNEVKLYNTICESCNIEKDFNIEDHFECSLSGSLLYPEDK